MKRERFTWNTLLSLWKEKPVYPLRFDCTSQSADYFLLKNAPIKTNHFVDAFLLLLMTTFWIRFKVRR